MRVCFRMLTATGNLESERARAPPLIRNPPFFPRAQTVFCDGEFGRVEENVTGTYVPLIFLEDRLLTTGGILENPR